MGEDVVKKLKGLKEDKMYEMIGCIEQLNAQLNREYDEEIRKGTEIGIYDKNDKNAIE